MEIADISINQQSTISSALAPEGNNGQEFNSFLQLLTAQIRNQDPLAPLDSTQFVEQLATFSTLEQQVRSNSSLEGIAQGINELQSLIANQWLGQTVSVESSNLTFSGEPIEFGFVESDEASRSVLTIRDNENRVIWSETLNSDQDVYSWDGRTASNERAALDRPYHFSIDMYNNQAEFLGSVAPRVVTTVTDVSTTQDGAIRLGTDITSPADLGSVQMVERAS